MVTSFLRLLTPVDGQGSAPSPAASRPGRLQDPLWVPRCGTPHRPHFCSRCGGQLVPVKHMTLAFPSSRALTSRSPLSPRKGGPDIRDTGASRHPLERLLCASQSSHPRSPAPDATAMTEAHTPSAGCSTGFHLISFSLSLSPPSGGPSLPQTNWLHPSLHSRLCFSGTRSVALFQGPLYVMKTCMDGVASLRQPGEVKPSRKGPPLFRR